MLQKKSLICLLVKNCVEMAIIKGKNKISLVYQFLVQFYKSWNKEWGE